MFSFFSKVLCRDKRPGQPGTQAQGPLGRDVDQEATRADPIEIYSPDHERCFMVSPGDDAVFSGITDRGMARRSNQDYLLIDPLREIFMVADGMGGASAGEVASRQAVHAAYDYLLHGAKAGTHEDGPCAQAVHEAFRMANQAVRDMAKEYPEMTGMGTTMVAACMSGQQLCIGWIGDSRAYLLREKRALEQLTGDHSVVWEEYRAGRLTRKDARHHPARNRLTRAIGVDSTIQCDSVTVQISGNDRLLLCSDGLWGMLPDSSIEEVLRQADTARRAARQLVDMANMEGGRDNITVIVRFF